MLGLLYDVHGNLPALEAVLSDCPAERFLLGGDYASFGAWPVETVERLRELDAEWIRGNVDRWLVDAHDAPDMMVPLIERSREMVGERLCEELAALPESTTRTSSSSAKGRAASRSSTRAASACRSTATTAPPTPCCTTTGASRCGAS